LLGVRSGIWRLSPALHCSHIDFGSDRNRAEESPDPLIEIWNTWARAKAAERAATMPPERAAAFLSALEEPRYFKA
jgi:flagellar motility protein MotE (MotC chaperone)